MKKPPSCQIDKNGLNRLRTYLLSKPRDLLLCDLLTSHDLPVKFLLNLKVRDLSNLAVGDRYILSQSENEVLHSILMTDGLNKTWQHYLAAVRPKQDDYIFKSRKGIGPIKISSVSLMAKKWFEAVGIGSRSAIRQLRYFQSSKDREVHPSDNSQQTNSDSSSLLGAVKAKTINQTVYQKLFTAIATGRIPPGSRLITHKLAAEMKVSQAPVREALRLLEGIGLTSPPQKKGRIVNRLSLQEFNEIFEMRRMLEAKAVEKAVPIIDRNSLVKLNELQKSYTCSVDEKNIEKMFSLNQQLHHTIYTFADMPILMTVIKWLWDRMSPYVHLLFRLVDNKYHAGVEHHEGLLKSIQCQDIVKAKAYLDKDLVDARTKLMIHFDKL